MLNEELNTLNEIGTIKEREISNELQDARKSLISVSCSSNIT